MIPAFIMDFRNIILGKKTMYRKAYKKTEKVLMMMSYFGTREWNFKNENIRRLINETKKFEFSRGHLNFDIESIDWKEYFTNYIPGIKRYFFKESCENVEKLQVSYERLRKLHNFVKYLIYVILARKMFKVLSVLMSKVVFKMIVK
jgi:Male sterility protein